MRVLDDETAVLGPDQEISEALSVVIDDEEPRACGVKPLRADPGEEIIVADRLREILERRA